MARQQTSRRLTGVAGSGEALFEAGAAAAAAATKVSVARKHMLIKRSYCGCWKVKRATAPASSLDRQETSIVLQRVAGCGFIVVDNYNYNDY